MTQQSGYTGIIFDVISEVVIERSPVIRATPDEAYRDAQALVGVVNEGAEAYDDESDGNTTVGRVDDSYCFVEGPNGIEWDYPVVQAEERQQVPA